MTRADRRNDETEQEENYETGQEEGIHVEEGGGGGTGAVEGSPFLAYDIAAHRGVCFRYDMLWGDKEIPHWRGRGTGWIRWFAPCTHRTGHLVRRIRYRSCVRHIPCICIP